MLFYNAMKRTEKFSFFQRCVGRCEAQDGLFLLTSEQSFRSVAVCGSGSASREERSAAVIGIEWRVFAQFEWYRGECLRLKYEAEIFLFYRGISISYFDLSNGLDYLQGNKFPFRVRFA